AALDDRVPHAGDGLEAELAAAVTIRVREINQRGAAHQEILQDAMVDECDVLRRHALIVERIVAEQYFAVDFLCGGIVAHGNEIGKNRLADFTCDSLSLTRVFLAETLQTMPENLVKEDGSGATGEERGPGERLDERGLLQCGDLAAQDANLIHDGCFAGRF